MLLPRHCRLLLKNSKVRLLHKLIGICLDFIFVLSLLWLKSSWPFALQGKGKKFSSIRIILALKGLQLGMETYLHCVK